MRKRLGCLGLVVGFGVAVADTTPQTLPLVQAWTNTDLITTADNWSGVPGIIGYRGDPLTSGTAVDPQTIVADGSTTPVDVNANQTNTAFATGGVTEFAIPNPTIGLKGSGTAKAPHVVLAVTTQAFNEVRVRYTLRDLDGSANNSIQPIALQFRAGTTGDFTNVPAAFIADATTGPNTNGPDIPIHVALPPAAARQPVLQIRFITTDALGTDEYVGIDDIAVTDAASATGVAGPPVVDPGDPIQFNVTVNPAVAPASTGLAVVCDASALGGSATQALFDDGTNGDATAGDNTFAFATTVGAAIPAGDKTVACTVTDAQARRTAIDLPVSVLPQCGDGVVESTEACDDDDLDPGDGCSATCTIEPGYTCTGSPSVCTDVDECAMGTDTCSDNASCQNTAGSFTCACNSGYEGDGMTCTDVDECATETDTCDDNATCTNTPGTFTCACNDGYSGDGMTCVADSACGDGTIATGEQCDDGDTDDGDGCDAACEIEPNYTCSGEPSTCIPDRDGDGIANASDNCPMVANPDQADGDGDGVGDKCEITNPDMGGDGSGCCSTGSDNTGGIVLAFATLLALRRRRPFAVPSRRCSRG